jgi:hypothetical protein
VSSVPTLAPHPLVVQLAIGLYDHGDKRLKDAVDTLQEARVQRRRDLKRSAPEAAPGEEGREGTAGMAGPPAVDDYESEPTAEANAVAKQLGEQLNLRNLTLFAGYLGPRFEHRGSRWRLLYLDERLQTWLLASTDGIVDERRQRDEMAAFGCRDAIWVKGDAQVIQGEGPQSIEGRFLSGEFTRAADVAPAPAGGAQEAVTGPFCGSPFCCYGARSRR